jgi:F0F1-type ATP synthase delta subunit
MNSLLKNVFTKEDLLSLKQEISEIQKKIFSQSGLLSEKAKNIARKELLEFILEAESKGEIYFDPKEQFEFLENLKRRLESLPVLKMVLAFSPPLGTIERISQFLERDLGKKIILDLSCNPEIIGGTILEYEGKYINLSLAKNLERVLKINE